MRYTIYKITNLLNGKFYIGKHQTSNPLDGYFGSGRALKSAIKLHGKENFTKEILFEFDSEEEMNAKERDLITLELVNDPASYNMAVGGEGGPHFKGRQHSSETKERISQSLTGKQAASVSEETRAKLSEKSKGNKSKTGQQTSEEVKAKIAKSMTGKKHSEETKQKLREARLRTLDKSRVGQDS
jgi:group I intron endonuclease